MAATDVEIKSNITMSSLQAMHDQLDILWTCYLDALSEYTSAQAALQREMKAGFFQLAQANFKSPGRRYGQDYYDQRASASTRAKIESLDGSHKVNILQNESAELETGSDTNDNRAVEQFSADDKSLSTQNETQLPSPELTPEPEEPKVAPEPATRAESDHQNKQANQSNPLRWFGILVPPALRNAQGSFSSTLHSGEGIADAVNAARSLRELEVDIRKLRKLIKRAERDDEVQKDAVGAPA